MEESLFSLAAAANFFTLLCTLFFLFYRKSRSHQENKTVVSSLSLMSPPSSLLPNWKHHVFPSFHGADVRKAFLSHVLKEFRIKGINPFIDNAIERSKSIGPELIEAIRGSRIAIIFLSKNYASSTWCLDELVEIIKCREELGQTVLVLFYEVDPTDVKKQTGDFGNVFRKTCKGKTKDEIRKWRHALAEVAKIAGYHSSNWDNEAEMIEKIATDVSDKLNNSTSSSDFDGLVGMESHMMNLGALLRLDLEEVRIIGILGPSGIGKTTIARFLFNQHSGDFQLSVFMDNINRRYAIPSCSDDYSVKLYLQEQFLSLLTNEVGFKIPHLGIAKDRLKDKKVLVVLDGVDRLVQLEAMAKESCWFGPRSRIIITTQDEKVLRGSGVNHIYRVDFPSDDDALQMFCMYAFGQKSPKDGFEELAWEVTRHVGELPLGLRVMGSYFRGMSEQEWRRALPRLMTRLDGEIESILKFSYDALCDEDQNLFLHIACFFTGEKINRVEGCLENCFTDVTQGLRVLAEKSLISLSNFGYIRMHNLLGELGKEIVRKQSVSEPWKRQFLNDAKYVGEVIGDDEAGNSSVIGIDGDTNGWFPRSLNSLLSPKLRVLTWKNHRMPCFPSSFHPKFLVKLDMRYSSLEKLWEETQPLNSLKWIDLSFSSKLKELPDLSTATNLQELNLTGCYSLVELSSSIGNAINLRKLNLTGCCSLMELPSSIGNAINLQKLNLNHCSSLVKLPSSIGNAINIRKLILDNCLRLMELPSSIGNLINMKLLVISYCEGLVKLPSSIGNLINMKRLDISYCEGLVKLPSSIGNLISLKELRLACNSSLVELPSSITNITSLETFSLGGCSSLKKLDPWIGRVSCLHRLVLSGMQKLVSLPQLPYSLKDLRAANCESLERLNCFFLNPDIRLNFAECFKLNQEARDLIITTPTNEYAIFSGEEVPECFTYRAFGSSLTVKLNQKPFGTSTKFRACILLADANNKVYEFWTQPYVSWSITSKQNAFHACRSGTKKHGRKDLGEKLFPGHLYIFEVEATEVTSSELVIEFKFHSRYTSEVWEIKECGMLQLV